MEKEMEKGKNIMKMVNYNLKEIIIMEKDGMGNYIIKKAIKLLKYKKGSNLMMKMKMINL